MRTRRPTLDQKTSRHVFFRRMLLGIVGLLILGVVILLARLPITKVECETQLHTYCQPEQESILANLKQKPWLWTRILTKELEAQLQNTDLSLTETRVRRTWPGHIKIILTLAAPLFHTQVDGQSYLVHESGTLSPSMDDTTLFLAFPAEMIKNHRLDLPNDILLTLQTLTSGVQRLSAYDLVTKIEWVNSDEVRAITSSGKRWLLRPSDSEDLHRQLATLQAFLQSPTIDTTYGELDVRFKDLVVR